ncbi:MAG: glycerophosphodiester phosphodiesterase family protein [Gammaproteobacteria bacterium]|nr:glycerophosphodiester phosphodiesterase family protein [Gammaproteobacteria bacterium]
MKDALIGHRGEPDSWPENSLAGFEAALAAGARYIETDVQLTADSIPVLSHDPSLLRITGQDVVVTATEYETLKAIPAGYPVRFGDRYQDFRIARLDELVGLLQQWPDAKAFVEIKPDSLIAHGQTHVINTIMDTLRPVATRCVLISFDYDALVHIHQHHRIPVGWVLPEWSATNHSRAVKLGPEYLFTNHKRLPPKSEDWWPGPWQWVIYTVNDAVEVQAYLDRGIPLIETNAITRLLPEPGTGNTKCD